MALQVYTDGAKKDGVGSWAYVISDGQNILREASGVIKSDDGNRMEIFAAIQALSSIDKRSDLVLYSDSRILVDAMTLGKVPPAFKDLLDELYACSICHSIQWKWVKSHAGNLHNERCDVLCVQARECAAGVNSI